MAEVYGIISIEASLDGCSSDFIAEGVRQAVDGIESGLLRDLVETHTATLLRYLETRDLMIVEGMTAIATLDNSRIVKHKVQSIYVVESEEDYRDSEGTVELALQRLEKYPVSEMTLHELTKFLFDVSWITRRANAVRPEGLGRAAATRRGGG